jgi:hypothetical protein
MNPCDVPVLGYSCQAVGGLAGAATKSIAGSAFQSVVDAFTQGLADVIKTLLTFWINGPQPDVSPASPVIANLTAVTRPLVAFAALLGLLLGGARLAWAARGGDKLENVLRGVLLMTVVTGGATTIVELLLTGLDSLASSILTNGFNGVSVGQRLAALAQLPNGSGGGLIFLLAFFGMLASLVQVGIMLVRGAILAVLVGILPVAAAASIQDAGWAWFRRLCAWIGSFVLYKLLAAVIYAAAFSMIGDTTDLTGVVSGFALITVAILALPALLRLLPPSADAMGRGGGGAASGAVGAAATGAVMLSGSGSSAPSPTATPGLRGSQGPTGASGTGGGSTGSGWGSPNGAAPAGAPPAAAVPAGAGAAASGASAGAGPAGAAVAAGRQAYSGAKSAAEGAVGGGSQ